ncbi:hypothetical protein PanWU01x14_263970 [Parasponia andersonii]|uniref:Uncharacterized protein n=1 Tax=Parasponia andersonii TaxID=3476 RepID=A0A2P5B7N0_PARAD|nr:hypothetical protein PanWU01x14_263970 [Parasponia andersonii]
MVIAALVIRHYAQTPQGRQNKHKAFHSTFQNLGKRHGAKTPSTFTNQSHSATISFSHKIHHSSLSLPLCADLTCYPQNDVVFLPILAFRPIPPLTSSGSSSSDSANAGSLNSCRSCRIPRQCGVGFRILGPDSLNLASSGSDHDRRSGHLGFRVLISLEAKVAILELQNQREFQFW